MKKVGNFIKYFDIFGYQIKLNFDKKGDSHRSLPGGIFSIVYFLSLASYLAYCIYKLFYHQQDYYYIATTSLDLNN